MSQRVAVIGAGISGLAAAYRASELGHEVTLYEAADSLGGLGTSFPYRGGRLERFYHCILPNDDALLGFIDGLGLAHTLNWQETRMGFLYQRRMYPLNTAIDLLRFDPLPLSDRLRLGLMAIWARYRGENPALDDITAADWLRGMVGGRAFDILWKPLLAAKIGDYYPSIPALWLSSRLYREKNTKRESKGYLAEGYASLIDGFERTLVARGTKVRLGCPVESLGLAAQGMTVQSSGGSSDPFDVVICTSPLPAFQAMTASFDVPSSLRDLRLDYQGAICGVMLLDRPLSPYYWMPFVDSGATAQGVIEMSNLVPPERSAGQFVTYLVNYAHRDDPLFARSDEDLLEAYRRDIDTLFPTEAPKVVDQFLFRAPFVEPIWTVGYRRRKPPTTIIPGRLYYASTAHLYPRVNSWNSCCEVVNEMMTEFVAHTESG